MQGERAFRQCQTDRVDQERHVVVDDLDYGVRRDEAMLAHGRIEHPHERTAAAPHRKHKVRERCGGQILGLTVRQIPVVHIGEVRL